MCGNPQKPREREKPCRLIYSILTVVACLCFHKVSFATCSITWSEFEPSSGSEGIARCFVNPYPSSICCIGGTSCNCRDDICNVAFHQFWGSSAVNNNGQIISGQQRFFRYFTCGQGTYCYYTHRNESFCLGEQNGQHIEFRGDNGNCSFHCTQNVRPCSSFPLYNATSLEFFGEVFTQEDQVGNIRWNNAKYIDGVGYNDGCGFKRSISNYKGCLRAEIRIAGPASNNSWNDTGVEIKDNVPFGNNYTPQIDYSGVLHYYKQVNCIDCKQNYKYELGNASNIGNPSRYYTCRCPTEYGFREDTSNYTCSCPDGYTQREIDGVQQCILDTGAEYEDSTGWFSLTGDECEQ